MSSSAAKPAENALRQLPSVNELADCSSLHEWRSLVPRTVLVDAVRATIAEYRTKLAQSGDGESVPGVAELAVAVANRLEREDKPKLRPVINATGIILHTGLGRSPLAASVVQAVAAVARGYSSLEVDLESGERGQRSTIVRQLLTKLTGAESATVVNNNAAATLITLATVGSGRSIIVSRGELIEIGGSFRLPEIMQASGAVLREVGTTNRTRLSDYEHGIDDTTAGLLKVHTSNYRVIGFTESVPIEQLVELGERRNLPVIDDIGSGALIDFSQFGFVGEPTAAASVRSGADLVLFSGDKLLGGPQAGIIVGAKQWIDRIERNPLMRAVRVDKMTLAALYATLRLYRDLTEAAREVPILAMLQTPVLALQNRADRLAAQIRSIPGIAEVAVARDVSYLGGGSIPAQGLETAVIRLRLAGHSETEFATRLRIGEPSVVSRVQDNHLILDMRTVFESQLDALAQAIATACMP